MKASTIIRIVCWLVIACVLMGVLVWGIGAGSLHFSFLPVSCVRQNLGNLVESSGFQGDVGPYSENNAYSVPLGSIDTLKIYWVDGSVKVTPYDGDTIAFEESAITGIPERYALRYAVNGSTLTIQYCESEINWNTGWWNLSKKLEVLVPRALAEKLSSLNVDAVSASVNAADMTSGNVNVTTVSGSIDVSNVSTKLMNLNTTSGSMQTNACTADSAQANSVSGAIKLEGSFGSVSTNTVSGAANINSAICPTKVKMDSVSGASTLSIPENNGFTARYDSVSGGFSCDFPATISDDKAAYGDGSASFSFDSVSGSIRIVKAG